MVAFIRLNRFIPPSGPVFTEGLSLAPPQCRGLGGITPVIHLELRQSGLTKLGSWRAVDIHCDSRVSSMGKRSQKHDLSRQKSVERMTFTSG